MVVQWLGLGASNAEGTGSIPGQGTKIPHAIWNSQNTKNKTDKKLPYNEMCPVFM